MDKKNKIQSILDDYLKLKKGKSKPGNSAEKFWTEKNNSNADSEEIQASQDIVNLFSTLKSRDNTIEKKDKFDKLLKNIEFTENTSIAHSLPKKRNTAFLKIAAVLMPIAIIASFFIYFLIHNSEQDVQMIASTLKGSKTKLVLEDGTQVWLNGESELKFPSTFKNKDKRTVFLTGEAFFDVTKNEKKPFEVYAKGYKVNVLGTSFNVKAYPDDKTMEATLEEGKVDIEKFVDTDKNETKKIVSLKPKQTIVIYEGEIINQSNNKQSDVTKAKESAIADEQEGKGMYLIENSDLSPYISWKDNELTFKNEPLKDVAADLERWYNITVKLNDAELYNIKFTATFTTETVEQAIYAICVASEIDYEINKNEVILKTNKNK